MFVFTNLDDYLAGRTWNHHCEECLKRVRFVAKVTGLGDLLIERVACDGDEMWVEPGSVWAWGLCMEHLEAETARFESYAREHPDEDTHAGGIYEEHFTELQMRRDDEDWTGISYPCHRDTDRGCGHSDINKNGACACDSASIDVLLNCSECGDETARSNGRVERGVFKCHCCWADAGHPAYDDGQDPHDEQRAG